MIPHQYVWLFWSGSLLILWVILFGRLRAHRSIMLTASLIGMLLGISQPYFVPAYWAPPSVMDLALTTGFDLESLIFCFAISGLCVGLLNHAWSGVVTLPTDRPERRQTINRWYLPALASSFVFFPLAYGVWPWNPIYLAICTLFVGGISAQLCFPETSRKSLAVVGQFLALYAIPLLLIEWMAPDYTEQVWQLDRISGWFVLGIPLEEFLFAISFCLCCNGVYMLLLWHRYGRQPG